ncbi:hypothetical protein NST41_28505 [Paenibacillus sp. FSL L8-0696]|uniref:hypothetical protein n=1 Tax=Paenibacillus sp. FSL L8-0696 TaxID=2954524 RepID=UPI00311A1394
MKNPRVVRAELLIQCDVIINDEIIENINQQYSQIGSDKEAANQIFYAMVCPKIPEETDVEMISGNWDGICSFEGRFKNIKITNI